MTRTENAHGQYKRKGIVDESFYRFDGNMETEDFLFERRIAECEIAPKRVYTTCNQIVVLNVSIFTRKSRLHSSNLVTTW